MTHAELIKIAVRWLKSKDKCPIALGDFRTTMTSEQPDAIGWKTYGVSTLIECKASRADFLRDRFKTFRRREGTAHDTGMGTRRFYMAPVGVLRADEMPEQWGLLEANGKSVSIAKKATVFSRSPEGMLEEMRYLVTAIRRSQGDGVTQKYQDGQFVRGFIRLLKLVKASVSESMAA